MNAHLIKLLVPVTLAVAFAASAGAAESPKTAPAAAQPAAHQTMKIKRADANLQQTAAESDGRRSRDHNRINNDAGVPPSGVPSETMNA